jgi:hypothetical protein
VAAAANLAVQPLEDLSRMADVFGCAHEPNFVAACARVDPELLLEDAQGSVAVTVENGCDVIIVEDESLAGGGFGPGQDDPFARARPLGDPGTRDRARCGVPGSVQRSGASSTAPSARLA